MARQSRRFRLRIRWLISPSVLRSAIVWPMHKRLAAALLFAGVIALCLGPRDHVLLLWPAITGIAVALAILFGVVPFPRKTMQLVPVGRGEFRLLPRLLPGERFRRTAIPLALGAIVGVIVAVLLHPRIHEATPPERTLHVVVMVLVLLLVIHLVHHATVVRKRLDPTVMLSTDQPRLDELFRITVEVAPHHPQQSPSRVVQSCRARFRCYEHVLLHMGRYTHLVIRPKNEHAVVLLPAPGDHTATVFSGAADVLLDSLTQLPAGKSGITMYPFYHWQIDLELTDAQGKVTATIFPVTVSAAAGSGQ